MPYVMPVLDRYLSTLETRLKTFEITAPLLTMQSNGGVMSAARARSRPVQLIESGPAAGVIGTAAMARRLGVANVISLDMGGTTTKASVIEEYQIRRTSEFEVGGPISRAAAGSTRVEGVFSGTAPQVRGAINSPLPFTKSAVYA